MKKLMIIAAAVALVAMGRSAQASLVTSGTAYFTQGTSSQPELQIAYTVTLSGSLYTYCYVFTVGDYNGSVFTATTANPVTSFTVDASYINSGSQTSLDGGTGNIYNGYITWTYTTAENSDKVTFTSNFGPTLGGGSANDGAPSVSWSAANPGASPVPVPVPEASTVMASALMLLPLGIGVFRALRKERTA